jgi:hypothetical protein
MLSGFKNRCRMVADFNGRRASRAGWKGWKKEDFGRLARPAKRHYTFARRRPDWI